MHEPSPPAADAPARGEDPLVGRVISVIAATQKIDPATISVDSTFEELGFDSLDGLTIVFALEEEFDVTIPDEPVRGITSVGQLVESLRPFVSGSGRSADRASGS